MKEKIILHPVSHRVQESSSTCVPTCLGMLLEYYSQNYKQEDIDALAKEKGRGLYGRHKESLEIAKELGLLSPSMKYVKIFPKQFLKEKVKKTPILITGHFQHHQDRGHDTGHAVLVIGYDWKAKEVIFHDPHHLKAEGNLGVSMKMPIDEFVRKWSHNHHGWALWSSGATK